MGCSIIGVVVPYFTKYKPAVAVRKTTSADLQLLGNPYEDAKPPFLKIEPLIVGELFTKIGKKLFTQ